MSHAFSDLSGWPLHDATQKGDTAAMAKLVASGTDVNVREPERGVRLMMFVVFMLVFALSSVGCVAASLFL